MQNQPIFKHNSFTGLIGVATRDITPPVGIYFRNWGRSRFDVASGIHYPMILTCLTFQRTQEEKPLVLIGADLGWWRNMGEESEFRQVILDALAIKASQLMICLSHTHSGPSICIDDAHRAGGEFIGPYLEFLQQKASEAAQEAWKQARIATLTWDYGRCDLATNRDLREENGERIVVGFNPDKKADNTLLVGRITDDQDRKVATIVNYACHPTTLAWDNELISPDYIGALRETMFSHTDAPCLFMQGASGNLAPKEQYVGEVDVADKHGRQLAYAALSVLEGMLPPETMLNFDGVVESGAPLALWSRVRAPAQRTLLAEVIDVPLELKPLPSLSEIEEAWRTCEDPVLKERLLRKRSIRKSLGMGGKVVMPLWIWRLGDSLLIGQANEAYPQFQQALRKHLSPHAVGVMNIVNGSMGYLPPRDLYAEDTYTVWQTPFAAGSLESLTDIAVQEAHRIMAGGDDVNGAPTN